MTTHIVETDAEKAARATAKAAYETIRKARRALFAAHLDCYAPVLIPVMGRDSLLVTKGDGLEDLPNDTLLYTPDGLYVKHWKWWRGTYDRISCEEMWERILGAYTDGPLDGDFFLVLQGVLKAQARNSAPDAEQD